MKSYIVIALFLCSALAQTNCPQPCDPQNPICPPSSGCVQVTPTGSNQIAYGCICRETYFPVCSNAVNGEYRFSCVQRNTTNTNTTGCGPNYPNGCPSTQTCVGDTPDTRRCVCTDTTTVLINGQCVHQCPPYSSFNQETSRCQCIPPYVVDTSVNEFRCIPGNTNTCDQITCPSGFTCQPPSNTNPSASCVPINGVPVCGTDYRCPDTQVCVDTANGPVCRCREGFGGPNCAYRRCWLIDNNQQYGCWLPNMSADCLATANGEAFCVCRDGTVPPDCIAADTRCSTVDCSQTPNSRCIEGVCRCIEGYIAVPSDNAANRFTCQPIQQACTLACTSNKRCAIINGQQQCVCPTDTFGGIDCSRPACTSDQDCTDQGLVNSFCVLNTQTNVNSFCACKPRYTGERCDIPVDTCDPNQCPFPNAVCNNERSCACAPGSVRQNDSCVPTPTNCVVVTLTLRARANGDFTPDELQALIALLLSIDVSNIDVQGPIPVDGSDRVQYLIKICGDQNVDQNTATQDFVDKVNSGSDGGMGIDSIAVGDQTTGSNSSGAALVASVAVLALNFLF